MQKSPIKSSFGEKIDFKAIILQYVPSEEKIYRLHFLSQPSTKPMKIFIAKKGIKVVEKSWTSDKNAISQRALSVTKIFQLACCRSCSFFN